MSRQLIVVPNEEIISDGVWSSNLIDDEDRHGRMVYEYSVLHGLNLTFEEVGVDNGNFNGYSWGVALAKLGHISLHSDENLVAYIPNIITNEQYEFFNKYRSYIERFRNNFSACFINYEDGKFNAISLSRFYDDEFLESPVKIFYRELKKRYKKCNNIEENIRKR